MKQTLAKTEHDSHQFFQCNSHPVVCIVQSKEYAFARID